jgi:hypothetical protein
MLLRFAVKESLCQISAHLQNTFYNQLFEAAEDYVAAHTDELDTKNRQVDRADVPEMIT